MTLMFPEVTALYAGLLGMLLVILAFRVAMVRQSEKISLGAGESRLLERRVRAHGNAAEHIPMAVLMLLVLELNGVAVHWLHAIGGGLVVARGLHAWGLSQRSGPSFGRFYGILLTWGVMMASAVGCVIVAF